MDLEGTGGVEELGGIQGGEIIIRIYGMRKESILINKNVLKKHGVVS